MNIFNISSLAMMFAVDFYWVSYQVEKDCFWSNLPRLKKL